MSYDAEVLADNPLVYLRYTETSGPTCANLGSLGGSGTANGTYTRNVNSTGTLTPGITFTKTAAGDYVSYPHNASLDITGDVTYEAWASIDDFTVNNTFMSKGSGGYAFALETGTRKVQVIKSFTVVLGTSTSTIPNTNAWHHYAFTRSGNDYIIYLDGASFHTFSNATAIAATGDVESFGADHTGPSFTGGFGGVLDESAIYNTPLSPGRILAHYNAAFSPGTIGSFRTDRIRSRRTSW